MGNVIKANFNKGVNQPFSGGLAPLNELSKELGAVLSTARLTKYEKDEIIRLIQEMIVVVGSQRGNLNGNYIE